MPDLGQPAFSADKYLGHCRDQAEIIQRLIDATAGMTGSPSYRQDLRHTGRELPVSHDAVALAQRHWTRVLR